MLTNILIFSLIHLLFVSHVLAENFIEIECQCKDGKVVNCPTDKDTGPRLEPGSGGGPTPAPRPEESGGKDCPPPTPTPSGGKDAPSAPTPSGGNDAPPAPGPGGSGGKDCPPATPSPSGGKDCPPPAPTPSGGKDATSAPTTSGGKDASLAPGPRGSGGKDCPSATPSPSGGKDCPPAAPIPPGGKNASPAPGPGGKDCQPGAPTPSGGKYAPPAPGPGGSGGNDCSPTTPSPMGGKDVPPTPGPRDNGGKDCPPVAPTPYGGKDAPPAPRPEGSEGKDCLPIAPSPTGGKDAPPAPGPGGSGCNDCPPATPTPSGGENAPPAPGPEGSGGKYCPSAALSPTGGKDEPPTPGPGGRGGKDCPSAAPTPSGGKYAPPAPAPEGCGGRDCPPATPSPIGGMDAPPTPGPRGSGGKDFPSAAPAPSGGKVCPPVAPTPSGGKDAPPAPGPEGSCPPGPPITPGGKNAPPTPGPGGNGSKDCPLAPPAPPGGKNCPPVAPTPSGSKDMSLAPGPGGSEGKDCPPEPPAPPGGKDCSPGAPTPSGRKDKPPASGPGGGGGKNCPPIPPTPPRGKDCPPGAPTPSESKDTPYAPGPGANGCKDCPPVAPTPSGSNDTPLAPGPGASGGEDCSPASPTPPGGKDCPPKAPTPSESKDTPPPLGPGGKDCSPTPMAPPENKDAPPAPGPGSKDCMPGAPTPTCPGGKDVPPAPAPKGPSGNDTPPKPNDPGVDGGFYNPPLYGQATLDTDYKGEWIIHNPNVGVNAMQYQLLSNNKAVWFDTTNFGPSSRELGPKGNCPLNPDNNNEPDCYAHGIQYDVETGEVVTVYVKTDPWCSSGHMLPNGDLISTGGNKLGGKSVRLFSLSDPEPKFVEREQALGAARWYSSNCVLEDGSAVIVGGRDSYSFDLMPPQVNFKPIVINLPFLQQTTEPAVGQGLHVENNLYPFTFLIPDGNVFIFTNDRAIRFNPRTGETVQEYPVLQGGSRNYPPSGQAALLPLRMSPDNSKPIPVEVVVCGGNKKDAFPNVDSRYTQNRVFSPAFADCNRIKVLADKPAWVKEQDMPSPRTMGDLLQLPNGQFLFINGAKKGTSGWEDGEDPNLTPTVYMPENEMGKRFKELNPTTIPRMYHSVSSVLPDGKILVAGSNAHQFYTFNGPFPTDLRVEKFSPHYLDPKLDSDRPVIKEDATDKVLKYGKQFKVTFTLKSNKDLGYGDVLLTLLYPPFTTHGFSQNQRLIITGVVNIEKNVITAVAPPSGKIAPPGYYLMFVLNLDVPSRGIWVHID